MVKVSDNPNVDGYGGPGNGPQDRDHRGKINQQNSHKGGGEIGRRGPGGATSSSRVFSGGEGDLRHTHSEAVGGIARAMHPAAARA